jgi:hypothetical protein
MYQKFDASKNIRNNIWQDHPEIELVYVSGGAGKRQIGIADVENNTVVDRKHRPEEYKTGDLFFIRPLLKRQVPPSGMESGHVLGNPGHRRSINESEINGASVWSAQKFFGLYYLYSGEEAAIGLYFLFLNQRIPF